ncbi:MAG: hypothetical protein QG635_549 [Bacteroidota bacterium]|nr:hypothetical protein [Bacteroidota bacterium]
MNIRLIKFISEHISKAEKRQRFIKFARGAALVSVMLGSMALIVSLSVLEGFDKNLREYAVKFTAHIMVITFNRKFIDNYKIKAEQIRSKFPQIRSIAPVIEKEALLKSKAGIDGAFVRGIIPGSDITNLQTNIIRGKFSFSSDSASEIIIGKALADKLNIVIGDSIFVFSAKEIENSVLPEPKIKKFGVSGIYETGMTKYDEMMTFIPYRTASGFFDIPYSSATQLEILLDDINNAPVLSDQIQGELGYPFYCLTVFEQHSSIFAWIELQKKPIPIVLGLISAVAVLNIITTLLIVIVEKTNTIGVLRALGMDSRGILLTFVHQGLSLGIKGGLLGAGLALSFAIVQNTFHLIRLDGNIYNLDTLPVAIIPEHYIIVFGFSLALALLASFVPSFIAAKVSPLKAIRFK